MVTHWCAVRGQSLQDYQGHLGRGGPVDGLEILLASIALDTPITVVMADMVWTTARSGIDFSLPTIVLTTNGGIPCCFLDPDVGNFADVDTSTSNTTVLSLSFEQLPEHERVLLSLLKRPQGGRPLVKVAKYPGDNTTATSSETDPDEHLLERDVMPEGGQKPKPMGKASPQLCPSCGVGVASKATLVHHLRTVHPSSHLFLCVHCDTHFNNSADLASHVSNSQLEKKITSCHCNYSMVNRSRMWIHVHRHTTSLKCLSCDKRFPTKRMLLKHKLLHG